MQIQRYHRRPHSTIGGCGCYGLIIGALIGIIIAGVALLWPILPDVLLRIGGFVPSGNTADIFTTPQPAITQTENLQRYVPQTFSIRFEATVISFSGGFNLRVSENGARAVAEFTESQLANLCEQQTVCNSVALQNVAIDLMHGGGVVYADIALPDIGLQQRAGLVVQIQDDNRIKLIGIDREGRLYTVSSGDIASQLLELENDINRILQTAVIDIDSARYRITGITSQQDKLTLSLSAMSG